MLVDSQTYLLQILKNIYCNFPVVGEQHLHHYIEGYMLWPIHPCGVGASTPGHLPGEVHTWLAHPGYRPCGSAYHQPFSFTHQSPTEMIPAPAASLPPLTNIPPPSDGPLCELCTTPTELLNTEISINTKHMRVHTLYGWNAIPDPYSSQIQGHRASALIHSFLIVWQETGV
jgi:hypothetical protein